MSLTKLDFCCLQFQYGSAQQVAQQQVGTPNLQLHMQCLLRGSWSCSSQTFGKISMHATAHVQRTTCNNMCQQNTVCSLVHSTILQLMPWLAVELFAAAMIHAAGCLLTTCMLLLSVQLLQVLQPVSLQTLWGAIMRL